MGGGVAFMESLTSPISLKQLLEEKDLAWKTSIVCCTGIGQFRLVRFVLCI